MANRNFTIENSSASLIKFKHFTHKWTIDEFENLLTKDLQTKEAGFKYFESDIFSPPNNDRVQFKIQLFSDGDNENSKNCLSIYLHQVVSSVDKSNDVYFQISILNKNNEKCHVHKTRCAFENTTGFGWDKFIYRDHLIPNGLLLNGNLTLFVEINIVENEVQICESPNNLPSPTENVESTKFAKTSNFSCEWKINDFNSYLNTKPIGTLLTSPQFGSPINDPAKIFSLKLYPYGLNEQYKDCLSLVLKLETCDKPDVFVQCKFAILDRSNVKIFYKECMEKFKNGTSMGPFKFIDKNELLTKANELLPEDTLTIICELQVFEDEFLVKNIPNEAQIPQMTSILDTVNTISRNKSSKTFTHLEMAKFSHIWSVDHFKVRCDQQLSENSYLESIQFPQLSDNPIRFNLGMYPHGYGEESKEFVSIFLILANCKEKKATVKCTISLLNSNEEKCFSQVFKGVIKQGSKRGIEKFIQRDILLDREDEFLSDGEFTIFCDLVVVGNSKTISEEYSASQSLPRSMGNVFNRALESGNLSDFVFVVEGKEIRAHKLLLAARSPVFETMFEHGMKESKENRVEITDIRLEVFRDMLDYIYFGKYPPKELNIKELFIAADKYDLENLKILCEDSLCLLVNRDTAADLLNFALTYKADKLKTTLFRYINFEAPGLTENENFINKIGKPLLVELHNDLKKKQNIDMK